MALDNPSVFALDPKVTPGVKHASNITEESTRKLEKILEENHRANHIFSTTEDERGVYFHNHIAHHLITIWAMGGTPEMLQEHYDRNARYQRQSMPAQESLVIDLADPAVFKRCIGREENFVNFARFFENEIKRRGYQEVLQRYLIGGSAAADDILCRQYMGYIHGIIHINIALEFKQARMLAEGLAQCCVHHDWWYTVFLEGAEKEAHEQSESPLSLADCMDLCRSNDVVRNCSGYHFHSQTRSVTGEYCVDREASRDGVLVQGKEELLKIAARWRVDPKDVRRATAELQNAAVYMSAGAQQPPHICVYDFGLLHTVTSSVGHSTYLTEPSVTDEQRARLLEYSGRIYLLTYVANGCPEMRFDWLLSHVSKLKNQGWDEVFARACTHADDGHMSKLIRGIAHAQETSAPYDDRPEFRVKQPMFLTAGIAAIDSASEQPMEWTTHHDFVRGCGWKEAWQSFPVRVQ